MNESTVASSVGESKPAPSEPGRERDPSVRATHRRVLVAIAILCVLLAAIGFVYARWLLTQPVPLKVPGH